jgi:hypothetical protein
VDVVGSDEAQAKVTLAAMQDRLARGPHVTLGIETTANGDDIRAAFLSLTKRFHPTRYARMSPEIQRLSNEVFLGIRAVYDQLARLHPRTPKQKPRSATPVRGVPAVAPNGARATPARGVPIVQASSLTPPGGHPAMRAPTEPRLPGSTPPTPPGGHPALRPRAKSPTPAGVPIRPSPDPNGVRSPKPLELRPPAPAKPTAKASQPITTVTAPRVDEPAELASGHELLRRREWTLARQTFQALANRVPASRHYRALLTYATAKETNIARYVEQAIVELERAMAVDPSLSALNVLLADLRRK